MASLTFSPALPSNWGLILNRSSSISSSSSSLLSNSLPEGLGADLSFVTQKEKKKRKAAVHISLRMYISTNLLMCSAGLAEKVISCPTSSLLDPYASNLTLSTHLVQFCFTVMTIQFYHRQNSHAKGNSGGTI